MSWNESWNPKCPVCDDEKYIGYDKCPVCRMDRDL